MSSAEGQPAHARQTDRRLRRAIPAFSGGAPREAQGDPDAEGGALTLIRRAWPYIYRYIGGRWIGFGNAARDSDPGAGGFFYMPALVTALSVVGFMTAATVAGGAARAALFWAQVGHGLGAVVALVAWLTWLTRGRARAVLGLSGAVVGLAAATLIWVAEPGLGGKLLGLALLGAYLLGAVLRIGLRGGAAGWLRIESHLVYYYVIFAICMFVLSLNTVFLTDLLYQTILSGRPMTAGLAGLIGHPEMAHGVAAAARHGAAIAHHSAAIAHHSAAAHGGGGHPRGAMLSLSQRHALQYYYVALYFAGFCFSVPTTITGLPYYWTFIHQKINQNLRLDLMDHWHQLSPRYHTSHRVGDSIYRVFLDSAQISNIITRLQVSFLSITGWVNVCFIALFFDWRIAALLGGLAAPTLAWAWWYTPRLKRHALASREATSDLTSRAQEILVGLRVIKAYGQETREQARFEGDSVAAFNAALRARWLFVVAGVVAFTIGALFILPCIYLMATWAGAGRATMAPGLIALFGVSFSTWNLAAFTWLNGRSGQAATQLRDLNTEWASAQDNTMGLRRVFAILDTAPEVTDAPGARPLEGLSQELRFENVGFAYEPGRPILRDVSFTARVGAVTAIVGPTGSGKSTMMSLLLRLFDPDQGRILIDGHDLREFTVASLREHIAIAPQEPVLFATSVADNVRYAAPEADQAALLAAASVACADDFLGDLPQGWDTVLGERGAGLSPGQKQRLCIARALIKEAPIVILDEPTASLDAETEHRLMQNLSKWAKGRAVFIITHRLSTIRRADHILFIDEGCVLEAGAHGALMSREGGRYRALVAAEQSLAAPPELAQ